MANGKNGKWQNDKRQNGKRQSVSPEGMGACSNGSVQSFGWGQTIQEQLTQILGF